MNRLKELRINKKLSQADIAKIMQISQNGYSQYETEKRNISTELLKKFALFYNTNIDYILCLTNIKTPYKKTIIVNSLTNMHRLKEIREDRDLKQSDIANIINMSRTGYAEYEQYLNDIPIKVLIKLANFYNVSIDYLLYMTDDRDILKRK